MSDQETSGTPALNGAGDPKMIYVQAKSHVLNLAYDEKAWLPADTPELDNLIQLQFVVELDSEGVPFPLPSPPRTSCCSSSGVV